MSAECSRFISLDDGDLLDSDEGVDKHYADWANLAEGDRDALLWDPGTVLDEKGLVEEGTSCGRPSQVASEEIAVHNIQSGLGHPEGGIEVVEIPWGLPFAPCPTTVVGDTGPEGW